MKHIEDSQVERIIGDLLRAGVLLAAVVVYIGGVLYLWHSVHQHVDYSHFQGVPQRLTNLSGIVTGAKGEDPEAVIQLGILLLIATPICRVIFSVGAFALERDWLYVGFTLLVLAVLAYSLMQSS